MILQKTQNTKCEYLMLRIPRTIELLLRQKKQSMVTKLTNKVLRGRLIGYVKIFFEVSRIHFCILWTVLYPSSQMDLSILTLNKCHEGCKFYAINHWSEPLQICSCTIPQKFCEMHSTIRWNMLWIHIHWRFFVMQYTKFSVAFNCHNHFVTLG